MEAIQVDRLSHTRTPMIPNNKKERRKQTEMQNTHRRDSDTDTQKKRDRKCAESFCFCLVRSAKPQQEVTIPKLRKMRRQGTKITMVTAYDYPSAKLADQSGVDLILVGDSLGMVVLGYASTVPVTMAEMIHHCVPVSRAVSRALVIGDLPFGSYTSEADALANSMRLIKEGGVDAVKLEGGERVAKICRALTDAGVAVMGHVGLTPQSHVILGGYRCQGRSEAQAAQILKDATALQEAGCFAIVLECVPYEVAEIVTRALKVPTIGIGSGNTTNGQVLVWHDMMGLSAHAPKFAKRYVDLRADSLRALGHFKSEVLSGTFPSDAHTVFNNPLNNKSSLSPSPVHFTCVAKPVREFRVGVVGGGALGSLISARLSRATASHHVVQFSNRAEQRDAVSKHGIRIVELDGSITHCPNVTCAANTDTTTTTTEINGNEMREGSEGDFDVVFICTTADTTRPAAQVAKRLIGEGGVVVTLQNGWVADDLLQEIGSARLVFGLTCLASSNDNPSSRTHNNNTKNIPNNTSNHNNKWLPPFDGRTVFSNGSGTTVFVAAGGGVPCVPSQVLTCLIDLFRAAGLDASQSTPDKHLELIWTKLAANAAINPTTVLVNAPNGSIASTPLDKVAQAVVAEVCQVFRAAFGGEIDSSKVWGFVQNVVARTAANRSSMLQHVTNSRPTEIDSILGHVVRTASISNIPTPVCSTLLSLVLARSAQQQHNENQNQAEKQQVPLAHAGPSTPHVLRSVSDLRAWRQQMVSEQQHVSLVPTMGCLHEGHLSLVDTARKRGATKVIVSIFVNPTQFAIGEDLDAYPRTLEADLAALATKGVDAVFVPRVSDMYPLQSNHDNHGAAWIEPKGFAANTPEGQCRPQFFGGVATVCTKLFCAVQPNSVVFGQKDFAQSVMIKRLVADLLMPIEVHVSETERENDGLAMSSRNRYLTPPLRAAAPCVYRSLKAAETTIRSHTAQSSQEALSVDKVVDAVTGVLQSEPLCTSIDYVSVADCETGLELREVLPLQAVNVSLAVRMRSGDVSVRLIDNIVVG
eukprot:c19329_g2_i4.p1 GENE.c19329_g2_i4~~c19329_g2_i4.p1  ORF type:complete len:1038 (+),score=255.65 c19329_g2_i4:365-3478(+)